MGRKYKYIENLTEEEKSSLQQGYKQGDSPIYRRKCHCILLSHKRKNTKELSEFFEVSTTSIQKWLRQWEAEGLEGLKLKAGRGRKAKLKTSESTHVETVKTLVSNEPKSLKRVLPQLEQELEVKVSKKTLKRFLKNLNTVGNALDVD